VPRFATPPPPPPPLQQSPAAGRAGSLLRCVADGSLRCGTGRRVDAAACRVLLERGSRRRRHRVLPVTRSCCIRSILTEGTEGPPQVSRLVPHCPTQWKFREWSGTPRMKIKTWSIGLVDYAIVNEL